ncbi:hypothetical protein AB4K20DRAFT_1036904 [Rhizopus microsporus]
MSTIIPLWNLFFHAFTSYLYEISLLPSVISQKVDLSQMKKKKSAMISLHSFHLSFIHSLIYIMDHQENLNKHQPSSAEELDLLAPESTFESIDRSETENEWVDIIQAGDEISTELRTIGDDDLQEPDWGYEEDQQRVDTIVNTISDSITHDSNNDQSEGKFKKNV